MAASNMGKQQTSRRALKITLPENLYMNLWKKKVKSRVSLSELVEESLRLMLNGKGESKKVVTENGGSFDKSD